MFVHYLAHNEIIAEAEIISYLEESISIFTKLGEKQNLVINETRPINLFLSAIEQLSSTNKIFVLDYDSHDFTVEAKNNQENIGYLDTKSGMYLLYPDVLYKSVLKFFREQDINFPLNAGALWKELENNGYLHTTPKKSRPQVQKRNPKTNRDQSFIPLLQDKISIEVLNPELEIRIGVAPSNRIEDLDVGF